MFDVLSHLSNRHLSRSLTGNPSHVSEGLRKLYCEQKHSISHVRKNIFYHKVIFFCVCKKIISCCCLAHVRYIKILSWFRCFRNKIANFSRLPMSSNSQERLEHKENQTNYRIMTRKPRSHAGIGHFTVMGGSEADGDLVLVQTFLLYYVNQVILMLTSIFQGQFP